MTGNWTAIVINYNGAGFIEACLHALESSTLRPAEILVVDNGSTDESLLELNGYPRAQLLAQQQNLGFSGAANVGLDAVETELAVILNPDVEVSASFGNDLVALFEQDSRLGAAGPLLLYPDEQTIQHAGGRIERPLMTTSHYLYAEALDSVQLIQRNVDFVTGGAMVLRMEAVREVGGFDPLLAPVYYEDVDLCVRLRASGWGVQFTPSLRALHHEGVTLQRQPTYFHFLHRNRIQFARKHLSSAEWAESFVPAEIARLRAEIQHLREGDWLTISGANAVESLLRGPEAWAAGSALSPALLDDLRTSVEEAKTGWEVTGEAPAAGNPLARMMAGMFNMLGGRRYMHAALSGQREFNASVVRALEAQERVSRDLLATNLLIAVDMLGSLRHEPHATGSDSRRET